MNEAALWEWILVIVFAYIGIAAIVGTLSADFFQDENVGRDATLKGLLWPILFSIWIIRGGPIQAYHIARKNIPTYLGPTRDIIKKAWKK